MRQLALVVLGALYCVAVGCAGSGDEGGGGAGAGAGGAGGGHGGSTATAGAGGGTASSSGTGGGAGAGAGGQGPDPCTPIDGVSYQSLPTVGPVTDRPAPVHPDLNLKLRGWEIVGGTLGLITIGGPTDPLAPKLNTLFAPDRVPSFTTNYQVYQWDWNGDTKGPLITQPECTLGGFATTAGEVLALPVSGYDIGGGQQARVLYADDDSITLKYTGEDNVVSGYTIHVVGLCVEPTLRSRYQADDLAGRQQLPALAGDQPIGRARGAEIQVAIRDTGAFMDPRSKKDWWP